ncbi:MAG: hypothetical protein M3N34_02070 [Pseudomonadota bacterium]|nr:hypothetical protein [Pseudomonadota bacterium]
MPHHPTTFAGESGSDNPVGWDDQAILHRRSDAGVMHDFRVARHGTLAELVHQVTMFPEEVRSQYRIERPGGKEYEPYEIAALAKRPDFPL